MEFTSYTSLPSLFRRPSHPVPSPHHQTLLSKSLYEHFLLASTIAAVALSSKSIQNSSLAPNCLLNIAVNPETLLLFAYVFDPESALPIQFSPEIEINFHKLSDAPPTSYQNRNQYQILSKFLSCLGKTKYFCKSLRAVRLATSPESERLRGLLWFLLAGDGCSCAPPENTEEAAKNFPRLESLSFVLGIPSDFEIDNLLLLRPKNNNTSLLPNLTAVDARPSFARNRVDHSSTISRRLLDTIHRCGKLPRLTDLNLGFACCDVTDENLEELATKCGSTLKKLCAMGLHQATSEGLKRALTLLPNLTSLDVSSCLADLAIFERSPNFLQHLTELDIGSNDKLTDECLDNNNIGALKKLEILKLDYCLAITSRGLLALAHSDASASLKSLSIIGCTWIEADADFLASFDAFARIGMLQNVEVRGDGASPQLVEMLEKSGIQAKL